MSATPKASELAWMRERACSGKHTYGARAARKAARVLRQKGDPVHAYPCAYDHPGRWHVGHDHDRS